MIVNTETGLVSGCLFSRANAIGVPLDPSLIIVHDTAGRLDPFSSVKWFRSKKCGVSAHFVVELDGKITQMVPTNRRAFHAGASAWGGRKFCNSFALGIEIVSPGKLTADGRAWFGHAATRDAIQRVDSAAHGGVGYWLPYTSAQLEAVEKLCRALVVAYPNCNEIVGHFDVSPGRKVDPSPLFPFERVRAYAFAEDEPEDEPEGADEYKAPVTVSDLAEESRKAALVKYGQRLAVGVTGTATGLQVTHEISRTLQTARDVKEGVSTTTEVVQKVGGLAKAIDNNGLAVACILGVIAVAALFFLGRWMVQDYTEGRSKPSGRKLFA